MCGGPNCAPGQAFSLEGQQRWGNKPPEAQGPSRPCPAALRSLPNAPSPRLGVGGTMTAASTAALTTFCTLLCQALSSGKSSPSGAPGQHFKAALRSRPRSMQRPPGC